MQISNLSNSAARSQHVGLKVSVSGEHTMTHKKEKEDKDSLFISDQARNIFKTKGQSSGVSKSIELLMKQKDNIMDSKNKLIEKTLESGAQLDSIKDRLKDMDEQMSLLDEQMSKLLLDEQQKALGLDEESKKSAEVDREPKTEQEVEAGKQQNMLTLAGSLDQVEQLTSQRTKMEGEVRVLKSEIALDETRSSRPSTAKRERVLELNKNMEQIGEQIGEIGQSITEKLKDELDQPVKLVEEESDSLIVNEENDENQLESTES